MYAIQSVWEQQPNESIDEFELFRLYLTHRTISETARAAGKPLSHIAAKNRWRARKEAYVRALAHETEEAAIEAARDIGKEHARIACSLREAGEKGLLDLLASGEKPTYKEAIALVQAGVEIERLLSGQATKHVSVDLSGVSSEELDDLESKIERLIGADSAQRH